MMGRETHGHGDPEQEQHLPATAQAERSLMVELDVVVEKADPAAGERRTEDRQRGQRVVRQRQEGDRRCDQDQQATGRRRPLLRRMVLQALLADVLAELVLPQEADEGRPAQDRDDHRDECRYEDSGHQLSKFSATTSSPTEREPLTSTASPGRSSSRSRAAASAAVGTHSPP